MAQRNTAAQAHSASSAQTEERLRARMLAFHFEPNLRLDALVATEGTQVRLIEHRAPVSMVTRYAEQMKAGAVFPAIIVNDRNEVIDGNTRRLAAAKAGKESIAAYICSGLTALQARALSVELNQCHGLSMTDDELHAFVAGVVQEGQTPDAKAYARMTGVRASTLSRWVAQANFEIRAERCGIPKNEVDALSQSCKAVMNAVRLTPVLVDLTALTVAAKMSATDLRRIVAEANAAASESDALALIAGEREARSDQIRALANGFTARKARVGRATVHIAALLKIDPKDLLDVTPGKKAEVLERLEILRNRIDEAISSARPESSGTAVALPNQLADGDPTLILSGQGAAGA